MTKLKRRRYGDDVVLYTPEEGNIMTIAKKHFPDPWGTAQVIMQLQGKDLAQTCECGNKHPLVAEFGACEKCMEQTT